jgi:PAS domain S-box-containing protein
MERRMAQPPSHSSHGQEVGGDDGQPSPLGAEIFVRVQACGLNHVDHALGTGAVSQLCARGAPYVCGMGAAGTVIAAGEGVTRFAVGEEVFGHFPASSWAWVQAPCARMTADGPHVERRPEGLDPLAAVALAHAGLTAKTILRAAALRPGHTALVIGATSGAGTVLVALLADAGAHAIACATPDDDDYVRSLGAADTIEYTTANPVFDALAAHPDVDLLVDLVSFDEPHFITAAASHGTIVTATPGADQGGIPRIEISAQPGDLAALAQRTLDGRQPGERAHVHRLEEVRRCRVPDSLTDLAGRKVHPEDFRAAVLQTAAQPIWVVDPAGLIRFANPAAVEALGYDDAKELLGRPGHETIHYKHPDGSPYPACDCPILLPRVTGETVARDLDWLFRRDGSIFPVSYVSAPIEMPDGRGTVVALTDIEDRLRAEQVPREREALLAA